MSRRRAPVLVVGATGQLGSQVVLKLAERGERVRALVRQGSRHAHLQVRGVELAVGDLRDAASIDAACRGARAVVATASSVVPRGDETFETVEGRGYAELIATCRRHGHAHVVLISVPVTPVDDEVPLFHWKRQIEQRLQASGLPTTVFRAGPFMDDWLVFIGSRLPMRGDPAALARRPWDFMQRFLGVVGGLVERRGLALIPGSTRVRHAFISVDDTAEYLVRAVLGQPPRGFEAMDIAGPQSLSWTEVAAVMSQVLGRPVRAVGTPSFVFRATQRAMRPFSEAASNIMGLNWVAGRHAMVPDGAAAARRYGVRPTSLEQFLRAKASLPAEA